MPSTLRRHVGAVAGGFKYFMRVERPSHAAQRCPPVSSTVAQWRRSGGQRLVSSCDGPIPALPARSPYSRRPPAVLRRHVSYTCRGPPVTGRPSEPRSLRGTVASAGAPPTGGRITYGAAPVGGYRCLLHWTFASRGCCGCDLVGGGLGRRAPRRRPPLSFLLLLPARPQMGRSGLTGESRPLRSRLSTRGGGTQTPTSHTRPKRLECPRTGIAHANAPHKFPV